MFHPLYKAWHCSFLFLAPSNTDKHLQKIKAQILIGSRALISWPRWGGSGGTSRGCCKQDGGNPQGRRFLTLQRQNLSQNCCRGGCDGHPLPSWSELSPPVPRWGSTWLGELWGWAYLSWAHLSWAHLGWLCCSQPHISRAPHPRRGSGASLGTKHPSLAPSCPKFPHFQKFGASCCHGNQRELCTLLVLLAVGYQARSVMHQAAWVQFSSPNAGFELNSGISGAAQLRACTCCGWGVPGTLPSRFLRDQGGETPGWAEKLHGAGRGCWRSWMGSQNWGAQRTLWLGQICNNSGIIQVRIQKREVSWSSLLHTKGKVKTGGKSQPVENPPLVASLATTAFSKIHGNKRKEKRFQTQLKQKGIKPIKAHPSSCLINAVQPKGSKTFLFQDFELNNELKMNVLNLLEEVLRDPDLLPQERKATANILR